MSQVESRRKPPMGVLAISVLMVAAAAVMGLTLRTRQRSAVSQDLKQRKAAAARGPVVQYLQVPRSPKSTSLQLLGEAHPWQQTTIYAKVSGYLQTIGVDKGDRVHAQQVLGVIQSPELDHQYQSAVEDARNKHLIASRAAALAKRDMIAQEEADNDATQAAMADAAVQQLAALRSYETLRAPFNGIVTARYADAGALLQAATGAQTSALPVVTVAQTNVLRIYVYVEQAYASFVHPGDAAVVTDPNQPGLLLRARVARSSGELDPKTRTLLTEVDVRNPRHRLLPGSFVQVQLHVRAHALPEVPVQALVMHGKQSFVTVLDDGDRLQLRPVQVAGDDGVWLQVASGLQEGERVAVNVGDSIAPGARVQPVAAGMP